jgi:hypothetical protein
VQKTKPIQTQTNPISEMPKMNANAFLQKDYKNELPSGPKKQTQTNPIFALSAWHQRLFLLNFN